MESTQLILLENDIITYIISKEFNSYTFFDDLELDQVQYKNMLTLISVRYLQSILCKSDYYIYVETIDKAKSLEFFIKFRISEIINRHDSLINNKDKHNKIVSAIKDTAAYISYQNYWIKCITDNADEWLHIGAKSIVDSFHKLINNKDIDVIDGNVNKTIYRYLSNHTIDEIMLKLQNENSLQYLKDEIIAKLFIPVSMSIVNYKVHYSDDIWEQSSFEIINTIKTLVNANKIPTTDKNINNVILKVLKEYSLDDLRDLIKEEETYYILEENEFAKKLIPIAIHLQSNVIIKQAV